MRACIAAGLLVAVACGGDDESDARSYTDAPAVAEALDCADSYEASDPETVDIGVNLGDVSSGSCEVDGEVVNIEVYEDADHARQAERAAKTIGCQFFTQMGVDRFDYAAGENWVATPDDTLADDVADNLASTLGGEPRTVECS